MTNAYFYSDTAQATSITTSITNVSTSLVLNGTTGLPTSFPFILCLGDGAAAAAAGETPELVKVTSGAGTSGSPYVISRAFNGTTAGSHAANLASSVTHKYSASDATDFRTHEAASASVHGLTSALKVSGGTAAAYNPAALTNTTTETVIQTHSLGAAELSVGAVVRGYLWGQASVTGTPTLTLRLRYGGASGVLLAAVVITCSSGVSNKDIAAAFHFVCGALGATGSGTGALEVNAPNLGTGSSESSGGLSNSIDTTTAKDIVVTAQWSAASSSNTLSPFALYTQKVRS